jgi:hypothetical protein
VRHGLELVLSLLPEEGREGTSIVHIEFHLSACMLGESGGD